MLGELAGRRIREPFPGKKRQGRPHDGRSPLLRTQSLIKHVSKLVNTHQMSTSDYAAVATINKINGMGKFIN